MTEEPPRKRVTSGALVRDVRGRVLLVHPTYRDDWLTPGGSVEVDESPRAGAAREVLEELGVALPIGRLLVMQWSRDAAIDPHGALQFAYDGGVLDARTVRAIRLPPEELRAYRFFDPPAVRSVASAETAQRVAAALDALTSGRVIEIDG